MRNFISKWHLVPEHVNRMFWWCLGTTCRRRKMNKLFIIIFIIKIVYTFFWYRSGSFNNPSLFKMAEIFFDGIMTETGTDSIKIE